MGEATVRAEQTVAKSRVSVALRKFRSVLFEQSCGIARGFLERFFRRRFTILCWPVALLGVFADSDGVQFPFLCSFRLSDLWIDLRVRFWRVRQKAIPVYLSLDVQF